MPRPHTIELEKAVTFPAEGEPDVVLHGQFLAPPEGQPSRVVILCHPHPVYGGNLLHTVILRMTEAAHRAAWGTLRFNFRGVGRSTGVHGGGIGEQNDVRGAMAFVRSRGVERLALAGYSFGASVGLVVALRDPSLAGFIALGRPAARFVPQLQPEGGALRSPALFMYGSQDVLADAHGMRKRFGDDPLARFRVIEGADHFFKAHDPVIEMQKAVEEFLGGLDRAT
ncbi:MAG: dienelactone hydrolase family protein [Planctomycetes bacterium]|nr:dienelactone hydrolase family protein [Planctomycetota bacterium]